MPVRVLARRCICVRIWGRLALSLCGRWTNDAKDGMAGRFSFEGIERRFWCDVEVGLHIWELLEVLLEHLVDWTVGCDEPALPVLLYKSDWDGMDLSALASWYCLAGM